MTEHPGDRAYGGRASVWGAHVEGTDLRETIALFPEQLFVFRR
jgi:hypothetical protein